MAKKKKFENVFGVFVQSIGGEIVPRGASRSADYIFRAEKIVIELKTLEENSLPTHVRELAALVERWKKKGLVRGYGTFAIDVQTVPLECQREWLDLLETSIEDKIRDAHGQIRSTKEVYQLPDAKGLVLIVNDGNFLYTEPVNFMISVGRILQKKDKLGEKKFPHIRGVVYFSYRVPAAGERSLFWLPGTIEPVADTDLIAFQARLRKEWFTFHAKWAGRNIGESPRSSA